jgi:hypothetical protein
MWCALAAVAVSSCSHGDDDRGLSHPGTLSGAQAEDLAARIEAGETPTLVPAKLPEATAGLLGQVANDKATAFAEIAKDFAAAPRRVQNRGSSSSSNAAPPADFSGIWRSSGGLQYTVAKIPRGYSFVEEGTLVAGMPPLEMAAGEGTFDGRALRFRYNTLAGTRGHCVLEADRERRSLTGVLEDRETGRRQEIVLTRTAGRIL